MRNLDELLRILVWLFGEVGFGAIGQFQVDGGDLSACVALLNASYVGSFGEY